MIRPKVQGLDYFILVFYSAKIFYLVSLFFVEVKDHTLLTFKLVNN